MSDDTTSDEHHEERTDDQSDPETRPEESGVDQPGTQTGDQSETLGSSVTRRGVLTTAGILGVLGLGAGTASADASGQIGTSSDPLNKLYTEELNGGVTGDQSLTNLAGSGLTISSGSLQTSGGSSTSKLETSAQSTTAVEVVEGGGPPSAISASSDSTSPPTVIGGHPSNNTSGTTVKGVTIAGGGGDSASSDDNAASADWATVAGGRNNTASGQYSLAAGRGASASWDGAFVWGDSSGTTINSTKSDQVIFQASGGFTIAPEEDNNSGLEVQDKDGNWLFLADTLNHKVQVFDGNGSNSVDISHGGTDGTISTSTGDLKLSPSGNVNLNQNSLQGVDTLTVAPSSDGSSVFDVQDTDGNSVLTADTVKDKVDIADTANNDTLTLKHDDTDGVVSTSTGDLKLSPSNNVNLNGNKLTGTQSINGGVTGNTEITDLVGSGLSINSGSLEASGGGSSSKLVTSAQSTTAVEVVEGGGPPSAISASSDSSNPPTIIGGHPSNNTAGNPVKGVTIAGGGGDSGSSNDNAASADWATVPGGRNNTASGQYSYVAGRAADANSNDGAFVWGDSSSTTATAGAADEVRFQATGGFVIAPESDQTNMLDVQDSAGNSVLKADTSNHKVQVFDGDASDSVDISHGGTDGDISTSSGDLKLSPSGAVNLNGNNLESSSGLTVTTNDNGNLTLDPGSGNDLVASNLSSGGSSDNLLVRDGNGHINESSKTVSDIGGGGTTTKSITSDYTTSGEDFIFVDTSSSAVTVTLSTADNSAGTQIDIVDVGGNAGTNNITVQTEGSGEFPEGGGQSTTLSSNYFVLPLVSNGTDWFGLN